MATDLEGKLDRVDQRIDVMLEHLHQLDIGVTEKFGQVGERITKVEECSKGTATKLDTYEHDHTGPGGDHDRIENRSQYVVTTVIAGGSVLLTLILLLIGHVIA